MKKYGSKKQLQRVVGCEKMNRFDDSNTGTYWQIYDIKLFSRDRFGVLNVLEAKLALGIKKYWIATVNPEFVMEAEKDKEFRKILSKTSINVVDGIGLVWANQFIKLESYKVYKDSNKLFRFLLRFGWGVKESIEVLRGKYKDQVASGADLMVELVKIAARDNKKVFLLGGWGDRAEKTARYFSIKYQVSNIKYSSGEPEIENKEVVKQINEFKPDILLVAYGMKKQEFWINDNLDKLDVGIVMGVGRSFDYYSGELKRAPRWVRKMGMEWLYSLIKEPKRLIRQLVLPKFIFKVISSG